MQTTQLLGAVLLLLWCFLRPRNTDNELRAKLTILKFLLNRRLRLALKLSLGLLQKLLQTCFLFSLIQDGSPGTGTWQQFQNSKSPYCISSSENCSTMDAAGSLPAWLTQSMFEISTLSSSKSSFRRAA